MENPPVNDRSNSDSNVELQDEDLDAGKTTEVPNSDFERAEIIFNVLLSNPEEFESHVKPSAARKNNFMCTLNMEKVSIASARADDNGAYGKRGNSSKYYFWSNGTCLMAHRSAENTYYVNKRDTSAATARPVYNKQFVDANNIYQLTRQYRHSKSNKFYNMIAVVRNVTKPHPHPYFMYLSRWTDDGIDHQDDFLVERHGNAAKPHAATYYRRDQSVFSEVREKLASGTSVDEVYVKLSKKNDEVGSVSEMMSNPKLVHNQKQQMKPPTNAIKKSEGETLIDLIHGDSFVQTVRFDSDSFSSVNYLPHMINDLKRFCVNGNSKFVVDTTFQNADKLWLTDSSYENESLIDENGKHPHFPGPSQWQFRKNQLSFRRIVGELIIADPNLQKMKKIGHDLDSATAAGLIDLLPSATHMWCTQHLQGADAEKLRKKSANMQTGNRIMSDIYGCQVSTIVQDGLADALDPEDLTVKLESLKDVWEDLVSGFYEWFHKRRFTMFTTCLVQSARESLGISGRFYSNSLELKHRLLKKKLSDLSIPSDVTATSQALTRWIQENYLDEARKAITGQGKYRLAEGYRQFFVSPVDWVRMSAERKAQHFQSFLSSSPTGFEKYTKPVDAGSKKKPGEKRRARLPEPNTFVSLDSSQPPQPNSAVTPLKIKKTTSSWEVSSKGKSATVPALDVFNPNRTNSKLYLLVHKKDKSSFPGNVKRCEECKISFTAADVIAVKTSAVREYTDAQGNRRKTTGNVYLHFLTGCLKGHDQNFEFAAVTVPERTEPKHTSRTAKFRNWSKPDV